MALYNKEHQPIVYDDYITGEYIWDEIAPYIPKDKTISMPFYADGSCGKYLRSLGFTVIHKDEDFFEFDRGDVVVDNPPYDKKKQVIEKLYERNKPFMLLVPVSTLCYQYTHKLKDVQIIIHKKRPKFIKYNKKLKIKDKDWKKKSSPFETIWLCYKMNFEKGIIYM